MDLTNFAKVLGGARRLEGSEASRPTNVSRVSGTAVSDSSDGTVLVRLDAQVFSGDGSQYVELPTSDNVREGDSLYVDLVGSDGKGKTMMISGAPGSGDRQQEEIDEAATTATKYITDISDDGIWVTPEGAEPEGGEAVSTTSGWHISGAIELFRAGVSMFRAWVDGTVAKVRIGSEDSGHLVLDSDGISINDPSYEVASIKRRTGGAAIGLGNAMASSGKDASVYAYSEDGIAHVGMSAMNAQSGYGTTHPMVEARASLGIAQVYLGGKSLTVNDTYNGTALMGTYDVPLGHFGKLTRCRIDIAYGTLTVPANNAASITLDWQAGGFDDGNYIATVTPMAMPNGFNNVGWCVTSRTATQLTVTAWNSNSYAVTQLIGCIGVDSRYGTVV